MSEPYYGQPTAALENDFVRLDYLTESGPRIVRLVLKSLGLNLLAEVPDATLPSPYGPYRLHGGHRLWHSPEAANRTYVPDDGNLRVQEVQDGVKLTRSEPRNGITTEILVKLHPSAANVQLYHRLRNDGLWPVELAPWAITQLRPEGVAILPQNTGTLDPDGLQPNRQLALWQYTRWDDPRLKLGEGVIEVAAEPVPQAFKIGTFNHAGWLEYRYRDLIFRKTFKPQPGRPHPDLGCNAEIYANDRFIELETLGPLVTLAPGERAEHDEFWEILSQ
jgi:hypothetical protein